MYESDVHLKAGLNCIDCHRNGLDHDMVRGYENDMSDKACLKCPNCNTTTLGVKTTRQAAPVFRGQGWFLR